MKARIVLIVLTIFTLLSIQSSLAQMPVFEWARQIGGPSADEGFAITLDALGNVYTTGRFAATVNFFPEPDSLSLISTLSMWDAFVQKIDTEGNLLWIKQMGGDDNDQGNAIAVDAVGNVYTAGTFESTADFDPGPGTFYLTAPGDMAGFVQKLDPDGNFLWAAQIGADEAANGIAIGLDASGNVYTTGTFSGTADFDPGSETFNLTSAQWDGYIQKLDTDGNFVWAKRMGGTDVTRGTSIAIDTSGSVYTTGFFRGTADFDPGEETFNLHSIGNSIDVFIQKLDADGNFLWVKQIGGHGNAGAESIAVDASGNVYSTGFFEGTTDFDPGSNTYNLNANGARACYVHKLSTNGDFLWAKQMGGVNYEVGHSLALDDSANVYTTGYFSETVDFDPGSETFNLTSTGHHDGFIQKLDTDGNFIWAEKIGGSQEDKSLAVAVDAFANVYATGYFKGTVDFDQGADSVKFTSVGGTDIFVQKLSQCYSTDLPVSDVANLPDLTPTCIVSPWTNIAPTATGACARIVTAYPTPSLPIMNQLITEILWTYDDGYGNVSTQNQTINWMPIDVTIAIDGLTITANNADGTYKWLDCDNNNTPISGENNQSFTATANGNYAVKITEDGCVATSECVSIISVGLSELQGIVNVAVYPNPSSNIFNIAFEKPVTHAVLTITDIQGKLISTTQIKNTSKASIELNEAPGVYILKIKSKDGQKTIQLIKD